MRITAKNNTHYIKSIDTGSKITLNIYTHNGLLVDLQQYASVDVVIGNKTGRLLSLPAKLEEEGELSFDFDDDNLLPAGDYMLEIHLNETNGDVIVAPSKGYFQLKISKSLDQVGKVINVIALDQFEQRIDDAVVNANDSATYATNQGDYAKSEADRLEGIDVSKLDQKVDDLIARIGSNDNLNTTEKGELVLAINEILSSFNAHKDNESNPHGVTKSQIGLGNVDNVQQAAKSEFDSYRNNTDTSINNLSTQIADLTETFTVSIGERNFTGNDYNTRTIHDSRLQVEKSTFVTPSNMSFPGELTYTFYIAEDGLGALRFQNMTSDNVTMPASEWIVTVVNG